jgi:hypothetical protein
MNQHFRPTPAAIKIDLLQVEDSINTAQVASTMTACFMEAAVGNLCGGRHNDDTNAITYAINHLNDAVQAAHDHFHRYLRQEFDRKREPAPDLHEPDLHVCPSWQGAGLYRYGMMAAGEFFLTYWKDDIGWFELVEPNTGRRAYAMCQELWQLNVDCRMSMTDVASAPAA